jgi:NitT/TauT family transport system permease protein
VFAGIVIIAAVVMAANGLLRFLQARLAPWHSGQVHG